MHHLVALCVRRGAVVATLTLLAMILGIIGTTRAPLDVFPEFVPVQADIQTEAPGFSAQQVEELVTKPVEDAVAGATGLSEMRSESTPGLSVITVNFENNIDVYNARQGISELLSETTGDLPAGVGTPKITPLVSSTMDLLKIGLVSDKLNTYELRDQAEWVLKPRLLAVPGVAHVIVFGGDERQIQIQPNLDRLTSYNFTLTDLANAAEAALSLRGAGYVDLKGQRVLIDTPTPAPDPDVIANAVVGVRADTPILMRDVADVSERPALRFGDSVIMGRPGVLLSLASQYGANTLQVTRDLEAALQDVTPALKAAGITVYPALHRPANFIERALANLEWALALSAFLIFIVLYAFLRDWRSALITFLAIPLSLLAATVVLDHMGYTLNVMTLGGFAVALGVLVDDAIIGIENVMRRLRENTGAADKRSRLDVILEATLEVRGPVIYATVVVIAVFLPELFSTSVQGAFVGPLALAFILAVLASLIVALTATPALCALFLHAKEAHGDTHWLKWLKHKQAQAIETIHAHFWPSAAVVTVVFLAALALLPFLGGTLMPDFREGHFVVQASSSAPGTSLAEMRALGERISAEILKLPYIQTVEQQIGRAELSEDTWGTHQSEFHVELKPDATVDQADAQAAIRDIVDKYPGLETEVVTFLGDRISESLTGETAQVSIKVFGDDLDVLDRVGGQIAKTIEGIPGIADLQFARESGTPAFRLRLDPHALAATGLSVQNVLETLQTYYAGLRVGQTFAGTRTVDVVLLLSQADRDRPDLMNHLMISGPIGAVPLGQIAHITPGEERYTITHDGGLRFVTVNFNVSGRSLQSTVDEARSKIASTVKLPTGTTLSFTGAAEAEQQARTEILLYSALALVLILIILFAAFQWRAHAWLVLANLPFSLIGGIFAIAISGVGLSLGSMVGLVTVFGVSARNAILLLAHYEHLVDKEGASWNTETVLRGAQERLIPILMTAAVTALGLVPLALGVHQAGQEIEAPMAIAVLGGLVSSTLLNLVMLPAMEWRYGRTSKPSTDQNLVWVD